LNDGPWRYNIDAGVRWSAPSVESGGEHVSQAGEQIAIRVRPRLRLASTRDSVELTLADLRIEPMVRLGPLDGGHVSALAEVPGRWPPIVVAAGSMIVLDGAHRVAAARRLAMTTITGVLFSGDEDTAFIMAVQSNAGQGMPLSLAERSRAARRLVERSPERSDRAIGQICGLDHKTVARFREAQARPTGENPRSDKRVGRDSRTRPIDIAALRTRIAAAVMETPNDSLRNIARRVGASPETVRDVRARLSRGDDPVPSGVRGVALPLLPSAPVTKRPPAWSHDSACRSTSGGSEFVAWFDVGSRAAEWQSFVEAVPLSRAYEVADQARIYADAWRSFAEALERRTRSAGEADF
jgi:ParB-like chromosome segregation protein Spo0J